MQQVRANGSNQFNHGGNNRFANDFGGGGGNEANILKALQELKLSMHDQQLPLLPPPPAINPQLLLPPADGGYYGLPPPPPPPPPPPHCYNPFYYQTAVMASQYAAAAFAANSHPPSQGGVPTEAGMNSENQTACTAADAEVKLSEAHE